MIPLAHLRTLEAAGLIRLATTRPNLEYTFRHALQQEAVYHTLSKFARAGAHRAVAEVLETGDAHPGDLALHFFEAGLWDKALDYAWRAGAHEQAMYAPREALAYFDQALEAARRLPAPAPWGLLRARAQALETLGRIDEARLGFEQALAQARLARDQQAEWQSLLDLGFSWSASDYAQAGECFRAALRLARAMDDPACLGHSLNRLGNWYVNNEEPDVARQHHQEALSIFEGLGDTHSVAQTLDLLGITSALIGDYLEAERYYPSAIALFREVGDRPGLISAQTIYLLRTLTYETDLQANVDFTLAEVQQAGDEILTMTRAIGLRAAETFLLGTLCLAYGPRGAYDQALQVGQAALRIAEEIQHRQWTAAAHYNLGALYFDVLALPLARQHLEAGLVLAQQANSLIWIRIIGGTLARLCAAQHRAAATGVEPAWHARPPAEWPPHLARALEAVNLAHDPAAPLRTSSEAVVWHGRAQLALAGGDPARALEIADQLEHYIAGLRSPAPVLPVVRRLRAEALAALGRAAEAVADLEAARERARQQGALGLLWRIHTALGRLYGSLGQPAAADAARTAAQTLIAELAQNLPAGELRENFLREAQ